VMRGAVGSIRAGDVHVRNGVVGGIAGRDASVEMGLVGGIAAREASVSQGVVRTILAQDVRIEQSVVRSVVANQVQVGPTTAIGFVIARRIDGNPACCSTGAGRLPLPRSSGRSPGSCASPAAGREGRSRLYTQKPGPRAIFVRPRACATRQEAADRT